MNDIIKLYVTIHRELLESIDTNNIIKNTIPDWNKLNNYYLKNMESGIYSLNYKLLNKLKLLRQYDFPGNPISPNYVTNTALELLNTTNNIIDNSIFIHVLQDYKAYRIYEDKVFLTNNGKVLSNYNSLLKTYNVLSTSSYNVQYNKNLISTLKVIINSIYGSVYDNDKKQFISNNSITLYSYLDSLKNNIKLSSITDKTINDIAITSSEKFNKINPLYSSSIPSFGLNINFYKRVESRNPYYRLNNNLMYSHNNIIIHVLNSGSQEQIDLNNYFSSYTIDYGVLWLDSYYIGSLLPIGTYKGFNKTLNILVMIIPDQNTNQTTLSNLLSVIYPLRDINQVPIRKLLKVQLLGHIHYGILRLINRNINNSEVTWLYDLLKELYYPSYYSVNLSFNLISNKYGEI